MKKLIWTAAVLTLLVGVAPSLAVAQAPERLTLDEAIARALKQNPSLTASEETLAAAEARADQSWSGFLPQLLLSLSYRRTTLNSPPPPYIDTAALPAGFGGILGREESDSYNNYSAGVTLNHTLWDFGRTWGGMNAAKELRGAAKSDLGTSRAQVTLGTTIAYYTVLATEETVRVAEETMQQMAQHLAVAKAQAEAGVRQRLDVVRAEADLENAKLNLARAKNGFAIANVQLATTLGLSTTPAFTLERPSSTQSIDSNDREALVQAAFGARPELKAIRARERASGHLVTAADAGFFPALGLTAGLNYAGYELESSKLPYNWFAGLTLSWNALAPIPVSAASNEAEANARAAAANRRSLELAIRAEVESAALSLGEAEARLAPSAALVATAGETLRLAEGRYGAGAGTIVEVTDAQALYTQARLSALQAEFDLETARARLSKALGSF